MKNKVGIIICYFGKLPNMFEAWINSCEKNSEFDFLIFTDQEIEGKKKNVHIHNCVLRDIKKLAESKLNVGAIALDSAYKLCDYKPMFGLIFSDYLEIYDFWGMCDMDMVFGNLNKYITDDILAEYEKIYQLGHLTLYRNNDEVNNRFKCDGYCDWKYVVKTDNHCRLCERGMMEKYAKLGIEAYTSRDYADISKLHKRFQLSRWLVPKPEFDRYKHQVFYYESGSVYRAILLHEKMIIEEFNYIHLQKRKIINNCTNYDCFFITNDQLLPKNPGVPSREEVLRLNPYRGKLFEIFECVLYEIKTHNLLKRYLMKYKIRGD